MLPVSFENEGWQASCRPHLVISADSMTRKRHENAMSIVMKGEVSPRGGQAPEGRTEAFHERLSRTTAGWGQAHRAGASPQGGGKPTGRRQAHRAEASPAPTIHGRGRPDRAWRRDGPGGRPDLLTFAPTAVHSEPPSSNVPHCLNSTL